MKILKVLIIFSITFVSAFSQSYNIQLKEINRVDLPGPPVDISVTENNLYLICSSGGEGVIITMDITSPESVRHFNTYGNFAVNPFSFAFSGSYGYIADNDGIIRIVNFPSGSLPYSMGSVETFGKIVKVAAQNGYLYYIRKDFRLHVYDISNPGVPVLKGNQLVVGDANGLFVTNKYAYVTSQNGYLTIIDISNLSTLPIAGNYNFGINFTDVFVSGKYAYIPQGQTGVQVLNVGKLPTPEWVANIFSRKSAKQVIVNGYYTWLNDDNSIQAFYSREPSSQIYAGSFDNGGSVVNKIAVVDNKYIFICSNNRKLKILQVFYNY